ncbi:hypothetical protein GCM10023340_05360 [Nocardioides marinquilinus]|uniref:Secreted protein n=1 Tax=Nocardioides marinquilinus TaxID=1210400 RepID=A0ABP9PEC0_9ACTN
MRALSLLLVGGLVVLAGCNTDYEQDDVVPDAETVRPGVAALYAGLDPTPAELAEGECFADALLDRLTPEDLVVAGVLTDDGDPAAAVPMLDRDTAAVWVDVQAGCAEYAQVAGRAAAELDPDVDPDVYARCLDEAVSADDQRTALVTTLSGGVDTPIVAELTAAQAACAQEAGGASADPAVEPTDEASAQVRAGLVDLYLNDTRSLQRVTEGECFVDAFLQRRSVPQLVLAEVIDETGRVVPDLPRLDLETARAWVDAETACVAPLDALTRELRADAEPGDRPARTALRQCLSTTLDADQVRAALVQRLTQGSGSAEAAALARAQQDCVDAARPTG